jgi:GT2 family glycosyltransferase
MVTLAARVPVTAVVTAFERLDAVLETLARLDACNPAPMEIVVHVDGGETVVASALRSAFPNVKVMVSDTRVGPGGARNRLVAEATQPIVASFDDDTYPLDGDYFARVMELFTAFPDAAIVGGRVFHADEPAEPAVRAARWVADFSGGASAYRKQVFEHVGGYVPVPLAYGMEEVDFALRLHAVGGRILESPWLRVFHDTDRRRHAQPAVTAATISNIAVLASLRYPPLLWPIGAAQCLNRVRWLIGHGRWRGVMSGLLRIPSEIVRYRRYRRRLAAQSVRSYLGLRRRPVDAAAWRRAAVN